MNNINSYKLDGATLIAIIGIAAILFFLKLIINHLAKIEENQNKLIEKIMDKESESKRIQPNVTANSNKIERGSTSTARKGNTSGSAIISGVEEDEIIAVIMAAVSHASSIPISSLKIKSIKRVS